MDAKPVLGEDLNVDNILDDIKDLDPEQLKAQVESVSDDSEEIKVPTLPYVKFETASLLFYLKLFASIKKTTQDILSRSCLIENVPLVGSERAVKITMSDGIFKGTATVPVLDRTPGVPESFVLDYDSLVKVIRFAGRNIYLVYEDGSFFIDFYGGRLHIYSFNVEKEMILGRVVTGKNPVALKEISAAHLLQHVGISQDFLTSNQLPNLSFMFLKQNGIFLSNGSTVMRINSDLNVECSIGKNELAFVHAATQISLRDGLSYAIDGNKLVLSSKDIEVVLPLVGENFPASYEQQLGKFNKDNYYAVDFSKFYLLLSVVSKGYRSSGVVTLKSREGVLYLDSTSLDEKQSFMVLSRSKYGNLEDCEIAFSVEGLLAVLRSLKNFDFLNLTISGSTFCLFNDAVTLAVFGTDTSAKSDVYKMRKDNRKRGNGTTD